MARKFFLSSKQIIAFFIFALIGAGLVSIVPSIQIAWVSIILLLTIYLFAFEVVGIDVAAISIMVLLGLTDLLAPIIGLEKGLVASDKLFGGFSSNAVMSIIAVMIIGAGLDKTGIMGTVANFILRVGGKTEARIIPIISGTVGVISSFMQNVGAAALFLPVVSRISARSGLPLSRLMMPMGFCAILGGTITMVGSSPLILLNDLILNSNQALPADQQMKTWSLFSVTPIGIALVTTGIVYFILAGRYVLPASQIKSEGSSAANTMSYFREAYNLEYDVFEIIVPATSPLIGQTLSNIEDENHIRLVALRRNDDLRIGPGSLSREVTIEANNIVAVMAPPALVKRFAEKYTLILRDGLVTFVDALSASKSGIAEIVIPPRSSLIGKSAHDLWMRKTYGVTLLGLHRRGETLTEDNDVRDVPFQSGDTLIVHTTWDTLARLEKNRDFVVITTEYPHEELRPNKVAWALTFFVIAFGMILFTNLKLSVALFTGAIGMVIAGVLTIDEAYKAVSWKTVFLLASLIPLGLAVETTGTAAWIAQQTLTLMGDVPTWVLQSVIAILATFFTLVMSNVGATVLLVPLAVNIAVAAGANPAVFALTVAIATSNSFLIPTHQVNALIMGPAGYRVPDFMRAGGIMTILFLIVSLTMLNIVF